MFTRRLGRSSIQVSGMGLGTAPIGGVMWDPSFRGEKPVGYGPVDEEEALRGLHRALDMGVNFFDTADEYGCGRSERLLGRAIAGRRHQVVIATKFGYTFDEQTCHITGTDGSPAYIRRACEASLRRLQSDYIDLYLFHLRDYDLQRAGEVRATLEDLVIEGKIRYYGWSTDDVQRARFFAQSPYCTAIEHRLNVLMDNPEMLLVCEYHDLASINRIPLAMGVLTGKFTAETELPEEDMRSDFFHKEKFLQDLEKVQALRATLRRGGRTYAQGALGWIWARSGRTIPIPGFKTAAQVEENVKAMEFGPLSPQEMEAIDSILNRHA